MEKEARGEAQGRGNPPVLFSLPSVGTDSPRPSLAPLGIYFPDNAQFPPSIPTHDNRFPFAEKGLGNLNPMVWILQMTKESLKEFVKIRGWKLIKRWAGVVGT
jgi:hypothetical protein